MNCVRVTADGSTRSGLSRHQTWRYLDLVLLGFQSSERLVICSKCFVLTGQRDDGGVHGIKEAWAANSSVWVSEVLQGCAVQWQGRSTEETGSKGCRDRLTVKSLCCSSRGSKFTSRHPHRVVPSSCYVGFTLDSVSTALISTHSTPQILINTLFK